MESIVRGAVGMMPEQAMRDLVDEAIRHLDGHSSTGSGYANRIHYARKALAALLDLLARTETPAGEVERLRTLRKHDEVAAQIVWTPADGVPGAYRVGHSQPAHLADGMTAEVCIGGGAYSTIPNPQSYSHGGIVWHLTWAMDVRPYVLTAASIITTFDYLLSGAITMKEAIVRLRLLRNARAALAQPVPGRAAMRPSRTTALAPETPSGADGNLAAAVSEVDENCHQSGGMLEAGRGQS